MFYINLGVSVILCGWAHLTFQHPNVRLFIINAKETCFSSKSVAPFPVITVNVDSTIAQIFICVVECLAKFVSLV